MRGFIFVIFVLATGNVSGQPDEPDFIVLGEPDNYPEEHRELLSAAAQWVVDQGYQASEFHAGIHECNTEWCGISVYPQEFDLEDTAIDYRGCPFKTCVTMRYSFLSRSFESIVGWR